MKGILRLLLSIFLNILLWANSSYTQDSLQQNDEIIISWLKQNAIPIQYVEAGNGFTDLQPLKEILKDVKVVGLGESTHGTREFFQLKHRLLEFLVTELNFNGFALEASYAACQPINEYVLYGKGDRATVLTGQGFVVWDTEELAAMIDWMRTYNQSVPDHKKVWFYGLDFAYNELGSKKVRMYLQQHSPEHVTAIDSISHTMTTIEKEKKWPFRMDEVEGNLKGVMPRLQKLIHYLTNNKDKLVASSSAGEFDQMLMYTQVMEQWFLNNIKDSLPPSTTGNMVRSRRMGHNLMKLMEKDKPDAKYVVWEHNVHVSVGEPSTGEANLGYQLRNKFGNGYYAIGFEFNRGSYRTRVLSSNKKVGNLNKGIVAAAPEGQLSWYLSNTKKGDLFLSLRTSMANPTVEQWLKRPQPYRYFGWWHNETFLTKVNLKNRYDGVVFIEHTTATRPTKNALAIAARGDGIP